MFFYSDPNDTVLTEHVRYDGNGKSIERQDREDRSHGCADRSRGCEGPIVMIEWQVGPVSEKRTGRGEVWLFTVLRIFLVTP